MLRSRILGRVGLGDFALRRPGLRGLLAGRIRPPMDCVVSGRGRGIAGWRYVYPPLQNSRPMASSARPFRSTPLDTLESRWGSNHRYPLTTGSLWDIPRNHPVAVIYESDLRKGLHSPPGVQFHLIRNASWPRRKTCWDRTVERGLSSITR